MALAVAVAVAYANSLSNPFVLDDEAAVVQNLRITELSRLDRILVPVADSPVAGRPLPSLSLALNYAAGGLDVRGYHLVNAVLHLLCALLVFAIVRRTLRNPRGGVVGDDATPIGLAAALIWAVHPLNSEVVNYISQRTEALMAGCYLFTLYAAIRAASPRSARWTAAAAAACALGATAKESIVTAPLIVAIYDRIFLFDSWRGAFVLRWRLYASLLGSWAVVAALNATGPRSAVVGFSTGVSPVRYLLNQAEIITHYLRLTVWPDQLIALYGWPRDLSWSDVVPEFAVVAGLGCLTVWALWRRPAAGFTLAWFFITLAPASSVVPVATEVGAERRMYLPLAGLAALFAWALFAVARRLAPPADRSGAPSKIESAELTPRRRVITAAAPAVVIVVAAVALTARTVVRNSEYASGLSLARTVVDRRPTAIAHHYLAEQLIAAGRGAEAVPHLRRAIDQGNSRAGYVLGRLLLEQGDRQEGIARLEAFIRTADPPQPLVPSWLEPPVTELVPARIAIGRAFAQDGNWARAADEANAALALAPAYPGARALLGDVMFAQGQWRAAATHYEAYLARQPADVAALLNYGITQVAQDNLDVAIAAFTRATEVDPGNARARELLALARQDRDRLAVR